MHLATLVGIHAAVKFTFLFLDRLYAIASWRYKTQSKTADKLGKFLWRECTVTWQADV